VGAFARISRDVYGFKLGYYNNDYTPIDATNAAAFTAKAYTAPTSFENTGNQLFNGNISFTTLALSKINAGATTGYTYGYDQLNRLLEMRQHTTGTTTGWSNSNILTAYAESIAYDANGNILKYLRKGTAATPDMDSLNYGYNRDGSGNLVNNRLNHVNDNVSSGNYVVDIDDQSANNYVYDYIGNLKTDAAEGLSNIDWTVYGKIKKIDKSAGSDIEYGYDVAGNRTTKRVYGVTDTLSYYIRDAQGNALAVYTKKGSDALRWDEQHLYGSSRLGMWRYDTIVPEAPPVVGENTSIYDSLLLGSRTYELSNHLGNVLSTISDKKIGNDSSSIVNYYIAEVLSQNDYYPFGMMMPGRKYAAESGYRYGFNGKENDNEVKGEGNQQDYGMRIYDPRLGRFLSIDPLIADYPELTPYQFASNMPVVAIDLDGAESKVTTTDHYYGKSGNLWNRTFTYLDSKRKTVEGHHYEVHHTVTIIYDASGKKSGEKINLLSDKLVPDVAPVSNDNNRSNANKGKLTGSDYKKIGDKLGVEPAVVEAVSSVEASGGGFLKDGRVKLRFEGHQFLKYLRANGSDVVSLQEKYPNLLYGYSKQNTKDKPHGYDAYNAAIGIHSESAMMATSYGAFQIMGFNYNAAGFKSVEAFVAAQGTNAGQVESFMTFVSKNPILMKALKNLDFTKFANTYNGSSYKDNNYDAEMQKKYDEIKKQ